MSGFWARRTRDGLRETISSAARDIRHRASKALVGQHVYCASLPDFSAVKPHLTQHYGVYIVHVVFLDGHSPTLSAHLLDQVWRDDESLKGSGESFWIPDGHQEAVAAMPHSLPASRRIRRDNRTAHRHGLQDCSRRPFAVGWQDIDRGGGERRTNI